MKFIGFLKEFDLSHPASENLGAIRSGIRQEISDFEQVISYLKSGYPVWDWMEYWQDLDGASIGAAEYLTDGEWYWPKYYIYYLDKYDDIEIPKDFLQHCRDNNFSVLPHSQKQIDDLGEQFAKKSRFIS